MTTPTPPRDLSEHDRDGIAGTIHECDPAAVAHLKTVMAQQQPPRWQEAQRRQYSGDRIVSHLRQAAQAHAAKVRVVLSDEQYNDVTTRRADGESWAGLARALNMTQTTLMAAYARQTAAKRQDGQQCR
jgi:hypothetical protein